MASYHCSIKDPISRGKGKSLVWKAAYNARTQYADERTGQTTKDYSYKGGLVASFVTFDPKRNAPEWVKDPQQMLTAAVAAEKRSDAREGQEIVLGLIHELGPEKNRWMLNDFLREQFTRGTGRVAFVNIHEPDPEGDQRNDHAHVLLMLREIGPDGFGKRLPGLEPEDYDRIRQKWAEKGAKELRKAGFELEADRYAEGWRDLEQQGRAALERGDTAYGEELLNREATTHRGPVIDAMEKKGQQTERGNIHRDTNERNEQRQQSAAELKAEIEKLEKAIARYEHDWTDALAAAAIDKEKAERRFVEPQEKEPRARFGDTLLIRAVESAISATRHGEPLTSAAAFQDGLEKNRLALAGVTPEEAAKSQRENKFARETGRYAPEYQAGEIVIMREPRNDGDMRGRVHKLDQTRAEDYLRCLGLDKSDLPGIEATETMLRDRAQTRQRGIDAANLRTASRRSRGPERGGLVAHQMDAIRRIHDAERERREQPHHPESYAEKQKRDSAGEVDRQRYETDPDYRRELQNSQAYRSPEEKKRDRENDARAAMEQQDRGR